jgi:hypothetical protein
MTYLTLISAWSLVFRATSGIGVPVYSTYTNLGLDHDSAGPPTVAPGCTTVDASLSCSQHYRSGLLDQWNSIAVAKVMHVVEKKINISEH